MIDFTAKCPRCRTELKGRAFLTQVPGSFTVTCDGCGRKYGVRIQDES